MSALAVLLRAQGWAVSGSDRSRDRGETPEKFVSLEKQGIQLCPQDGSGIMDDIDVLIVSSAVEDSIPDVAAAKQKDIPIKKRAEILAGMFNAAKTSVAIGGTSGKSTVTAMTGWILSHAGYDPVIANGAHMVNFDGQNAKTGSGPFVAEVDESDGSIDLFNPAVAVVTNISLDHKSMDELRNLFSGFVQRASTAIINLDDPESEFLIKLGSCTSFSLHNQKADFCALDIKPHGNGVSFLIGDVPVLLRVPGRHNVANALAAIAAACAVGVSLQDAATALAAHKGIKRRFEVVGTKNNVTVIDDFAHNPDKIAATLHTLHEQPGRILAVFQPHGFGPTQLMKDVLIETFKQELNDDDMLLMPEIYYAGGTATKSISSADIVADVMAGGRNAHFFATREDIVPFISKKAQSGDRVIIMGARDDTLPQFAASILQVLP